MKPAMAESESGSGTLRLDKWLWHARFFKSRTQAASFCAEGRLRLNRRHVDLAHLAFGALNVRPHRGVNTGIAECLACQVLKTITGLAKPINDSRLE